MSFQTASVFLTLLCVFQLHAVSARIEFVENSQIFAGKNVKINEHSLANGSLAFGACKDGKQNCTIMYRKYPYNETIYSCNIKVPFAKGVEDIPANLDVRPFGKNKVFLAWEGDDENLKTTHFALAVVDMTNCEISQRWFPDHFRAKLYWKIRFWSNIILHDDFYEIFYKRKDAPDNEITHARVDFRTNEMTEFDRRIKNKDLYSIIPISTGSSTNRYVYSETNGNNYTVSITKPDGPQILLETSEAPYRFIISNRDDIIVVCLIPCGSTEGQCKQYDEMGKLLSTTTFQNLWNDTLPYSLQALSNGGFLLLITDSVAYNGVNVQENYRVIKVDKQGQITGKLSLQEFKSFNNTLMEAAINDVGDGRYCVTLGGWGGKSTERKSDSATRNDRFDVGACCFNEDDFSR